MATAVKKIVFQSVVLRCLVCIVSGLTFVEAANGQSFSIGGSVRTALGPVRNASIEFVDQSDTSKRFTALTDGSGNYRLSVVTAVTSNSITLPHNSRLDQNFPNPFSASTALSYTLNRGAEVRLTVFDVLGREVRTFNANFQNAGVHGLLWDGRNEKGEKVAAGVYFCSLRAGGETHVKKMLLTGGERATGDLARVNSSWRTDASVALSARAISSGRYTVHVTNTDSTEPAIAVTSFFALVISRDTTLDFRVKESAHYGMNLYAGNYGYDEVFVIDTDRERVVDTLKGFFAANTITVTRSGAKLYVTTLAQRLPYPRNDSLVPAVLYAVDPRSKAKHVIFAGPADVALEPHGVPLIIANGRLGTIDTLTDTITFFDSLDVSAPLVFDPIRPILYGYTHGHTLFAYNYREKRIIRQYASINYHYNTAISVDGKYIYCAGGPILDVGVDSLVGWVGSGYGQTTNGSLALSADGSYLYITDPAEYFFQEPMPSGKIAVLQTSDMSIVGCIDVNIASGQAYTTTDAIVITPDGKKAYVSDYWGGIFAVDLEAKVVSEYIAISRWSILTKSIALGVQ